MCLGWREASGGGVERETRGIGEKRRKRSGLLAHAQPDDCQVTLATPGLDRSGRAPVSTRALTREMSAGLELISHASHVMLGSSFGAGLLFLITGKCHFGCTGEGGVSRRNI